MPASTAVVQPYRHALERLRSEAGDAPVLKRVSELVSLLDLTATLGHGPADEEHLGAALVIVMSELDATRGAFFVPGENGAMVLRASRGFDPGTAPTLGPGGPPEELTTLGAEDEARHGLVLLCPIRRRNQPIAVLGLGPRARGQAYGAEEHAFLRGVAASAASPIENALVQDELRRVNRQVSSQVFQLHNLLELTRDLAGPSEEVAILSLVATSVMGHFLVSRCALYLDGPTGLSLAGGRGLGREVEAAPIPPAEARPALDGLLGPTAVAELPPGPLRRRLEEARLALAVPLSAGARVEGVLAIGERASRAPFTEEDREFAQALARQTQGALENARLNRLRVEKQRQDRELQIAREIQRSLFPSREPDVPGFEVAAESRSCHEVGGDSYDWIHLEGDRLALVITDVSGKGTPASLLMASVHASVQALAGTAAPAQVVERLNRFLFANTQASRFVTLFYAELDPAKRVLTYVNAGHIPPYRLARDGTVSRLLEGGPALGLLETVSYEVGEVRLQPGDAVAMVTDGVTEANSADEREFGDERVCEALRRLPGAGASAVLQGLVAAVYEWVGHAELEDDLTALVLIAR